MTKAKASTGKHAGGRPSKYDPGFCQRAKHHCLLGATNEQLAKFFEVNIDTIKEWMKVHPEFSAAIKQGREEADNAVAKSLYRRALGYKQQSTKIFQFQGAPVVVPFTEKFPPDPTSMIFWLKNRRPDLWRDRIEHTGPDGKDLPSPVIHVHPSGK